MKIYRVEVASATDEKKTEAIEVKAEGMVQDGDLLSFEDDEGENVAIFPMHLVRYAILTKTDPEPES